MPVLLASRRALLTPKRIVASAFDIGFDFRSTAGYVTDPATNLGLADSNTSYSSQYPYPTTSGGVTFGVSTNFVGVDKARDRNASNDPRLAGMWFQNNTGSQWTFRVDVPSAGTYAVRLAMGDPNASSLAYCQLLDGATVRATIAGVSVGANSFCDATGTVYTAAAWPGSNSPVSVTMAGTALYVTLCSSTAQTSYTALAHLHLTKTG